MQYSNPYYDLNRNEIGFAVVEKLLRDRNKCQFIYFPNIYIHINTYIYIPIYIVSSIRCGHAIPFVISFTIMSLMSAPTLFNPFPDRVNTSSIPK